MAAKTKDEIKPNKNGTKPDANQPDEIELATVELDKPVQGTTTLNEFQLLALLEGYVNERSQLEQVVTGLTIGRKEGGVVIEHEDVVQ